MTKTKLPEELKEQFKVVQIVLSMHQLNPSLS